MAVVLSRTAGAVLVVLASCGGALAQAGGATLTLPGSENQGGPSTPPAAVTPVDPDKMPPLPSMEGEQGQVISKTAVSPPSRKKREETERAAKELAARDEAERKSREEADRRKTAAEHKNADKKPGKAAKNEPASAGKAGRKGGAKSSAMPGKHSKGGTAHSAGGGSHKGAGHAATHETRRPRRHR